MPGTYQKVLWFLGTALMTTSAIIWLTADPDQGDGRQVPSALAGVATLLFVAAARASLPGRSDERGQPE